MLLQKIKSESEDIMTLIQRKVVTRYTPPSHAGFLGNGHTALPLIQVDNSQRDPFIMLMDDILYKKDDVPAGGPHPHAGFETGTLVLEGEIGEGAHALREGDFELMTAGSGIVHTETIEKPMRMRVLQLWLNLPKAERRAEPRVQRIRRENVPHRSSDGVDMKVYSGSFAGLSSPIINHTPLILAEVKLDSNALLNEVIPADFSTFIYVLDGSVQIGEDSKLMLAGEVGWLDRRDEKGDSEIRLSAGKEGVHLVLYSAEPQRHEIVSHGPFIADTMEDIRQWYADYRSGKMEHITEVPSDRQLVY